MRIKAAEIAPLLSLLAVAPAASIDDAYLTRCGPATYPLAQENPTACSATFRLSADAAKQILQDEGIDNGWIKVNGRNVVEPQNFSGNAEVIAALKLTRQNTIEIKRANR